MLMFIDRMQHEMEKAEERNIEKYGRTWGESVFTKMARRKQEKERQLDKTTREERRERREVRKSLEREFEKNYVENEEVEQFIKKMRANRRTKEYSDEYFRRVYFLTKQEKFVDDKMKELGYRGLFETDKQYKKRMKKERKW